MKKDMLINVLQPEECRIAILEQGTLEELYVERTSHESYVGNIYKGRIVNIEPSIQAAFVDFGVGRNGFLHVSDVEPAYYRHLVKESEEKPQRRRRRPAAVSRAVNPSPEACPPDDEPAPPTAELDERPDAADVQAESDTVEESSKSNDNIGLGDFAEVLEIDPEDLSADKAGPIFSPAAVLPPAFGEPVEISVVTEEVADTPAQEDRDEQASRSQGAEDNSDSNSTANEPQAPDGESSQSQDAASNDSDIEQSAASKDTRKLKVFATEDDTEVEPPQFMGSAERRTRAEDTELEPDSANENDTKDSKTSDDGGQFQSVAAEPATTGQVTQDFSDADLSFSIHRDERDQEPQADSSQDEQLPFPAARPRTESPEREVEVERKPETVTRPALAELPVEDEETYMPRRSTRGRRSRSQRRPSPGRPGSNRPKPPIQDIFKKGQEVLVQVIKEGIGTKGPTLSTYISIAGRYLVLMPGLNRIGVSRKITDEEQRRNLRDILVDLKPPQGLGFIIRTAGFERTQKELQRDLSYLSRLWQVVARRIKKSKSPSEIYQESDMITRTIRDTFTSDIQSITVDHPDAYEHAREFLQIVMPRYANRIKLYQGSEPMFYKYGIENEIDRIQEKSVPLPNGGSIVIEQTEALVAIDVNSGNFRADDNAEETAYQINLVAAKEIARQLRLRDLGGVIVNDFIDMRDERHRRNVERAVRDAVRRDRARTKILRMSQFGIIEMTRQRIRPSLKRSVYEECNHCKGSGLVKTCESMSIDVIRKLMLAADRNNITEIQVRVSEEVSNYLLNRKRNELVQLEEDSKVRIDIAGIACAEPEYLEFSCYDNNGNEIQLPSERRSNGSYQSRRR